MTTVEPSTVAGDLFDQLWNMVDCPRCGTQLPKDSVACNKCATKIAVVKDGQKLEALFADRMRDGSFVERPVWNRNGSENGNSRDQLDEVLEKIDADLLAGVRNGAWLDAQNFPPLRFCLPNIIPEGFTLFVGPPKVGKSWFMLALGLAAASGGRMLGLPVDARPVLYLALEDGDRRLQERCRILLQGDPIPGRFDYLTTMAPGMAVATIRAWLRTHGADNPLVILDTLGKVMPAAMMGETTYQRDYRVGGELKQLVDEHPGAALAVNHHDRKAESTDFVEKVSGTNGLAGAADTIVILSRDRNNPEGLVQVTGRDLPEGEYAVRFDGKGGVWTLEGGTLEKAAVAAGARKATAGVGDQMAEVIEYVNNQPKPVGANTVAAALNIGPHKARTYLSRATEAGRIVRQGRGLYVPVASVALLRSEEKGRSDESVTEDGKQQSVALLRSEDEKPASHQQLGTCVSCGQACSYWDGGRWLHAGCPEPGA